MIWVGLGKSCLWQNRFKIKRINILSFTKMKVNTTFFKNNWMLIWESLLFLITVCILLWSFNKGIDLSDEGSYLLSFQKGQEQGFSQTYFGFVGQMIFPFANSIVDWRIV